MANKDVVVLYSGGLDSVIMEKLAISEGHNVRSVYIDIGHEYAWKEKAVLPDHVEVLDMSWFQAKGHGKADNAMNNIFIPGRNMLFVTIVASKYLPDEIWLGALMGEIHASATDKNLEYRNLQNDLMQYVMSPFKDVKIAFPFVDRNWGKLEVAQWAVEQGFSDLLLKSSSCMSGEVGNCGACGVCLRRAGIFPQIGLSEEYVIDPFLAPVNRPMLKEMLLAVVKNDSSHYDIYRRSEILPTLLNNYKELSKELFDEILPKKLYIE